MIIGITGFSGSGKTRLSRELREKLNESALVISQDSYYSPSIEGNPDLYNFDSISALDIEKLLGDLVLLNEEKAIQLPQYDFVTHRRTGYNKVFPKKLIILEGHLIFTVPSIRDLVDILVYVDISSDLAFARRLKRDISNRGRSVEQVIDRHERFISGVNTSIASVKEFADIIVPNYTSMDKAIDILAAYINSVL